MSADEVRLVATSDTDLLARREDDGHVTSRTGFGIVHVESMTVIGSAAFKGPPDADGMVEIAYGVVPQHEGKGYATQAAARLVAYARRDPRVRLIRAHTLPTNAASVRVLEKNGFRFVGDVIDPEEGLVSRFELAR